MLTQLLLKMLKPFLIEIHGKVISLCVIIILLKFTSGSTSFRLIVSKRYGIIFFLFVKLRHSLQRKTLHQVKKLYIIKI